MNVLAINGSPRRNGNTSQAIALLAEKLQAGGAEVEELRVADQPLSGCRDCKFCRQSPPPGVCAIRNDPFNDWLVRLEKADALVLASPTYVGGMSGQMKCFLDRACRVTRASGSLRRKVGVPLVVGRRGGLTPVYYGLMAFFAAREMIVPCSTYWNYLVGHEKGEILHDQEGLDTLSSMAENMLFLMPRLAG